MALDGIVISNIVHELNNTLLGGRINKIAQPEKDELLLTIKINREQKRLMISASASLPLIYLTDQNKQSPLTAPNFCMLLRKHLNSAKIAAVTQPGLERIIEIKIEHLNEMGDACIKYLIIEIMGKHSNIIFCDDSYHIIDSIKHISSMVSSVREVLPDRDYFIPKTLKKEDPLTISYETFIQCVPLKPMDIGKALYTSLTGLSPLMANELCCRSSISPDRSADSLREEELLHLYRNLTAMMDDIKKGLFAPNILYDQNTPKEFSSFPLTCLSHLKQVAYQSISELLYVYYSEKSTAARIRQKSSDLRKVVSTALSRTHKKQQLQMKQLKDTDKRDKYKVYGELLNTYGYELLEGAKELTCLNYYTNEEITIPLDPDSSPGENAKKYFERYNKLKRTYEAVSQQLKETSEELKHLESISASLDIALLEEDLTAVKTELTEYGYLKKKYTDKKTSGKQKTASKPLHYISSDGFHIFVGKNNFQNDELTFKFAEGCDWWFHAKGMAGSHVVVKTNGAALPDRTFEEAAMLAAYYSKARDMDKAEVDYTEKKNVKKPNKSKPGFVVYYTNYSMVVTPDISSLTLVSPSKP